MGGKQSNHQDIPLVPQQEPICAIEPRFCLPHPVKLRLSEKMWSFSGDDFKISDALSGVVYFQVQGKAFSLIRDKKVLLDNAGVPVLNMKRQFFSRAIKLFVGAHSEREICELNCRPNFVKAKVIAPFPDIINHTQRCVVLKGNWREKLGFIYLGEPKQGGIPIGKVYRPDTGRSILFGVDEYIIEIAPGVDIALLVTMCIAMDESKRENR